MRRMDTTVRCAAAADRVVRPSFQSVDPMRISVVVLASLGLSASVVGAQALERMTPMPTSGILSTSISDRAFSNLIARENHSLFRFGFLSATLEHRLGEHGVKLAVPLDNPPAASIASEGGGHSEPAPAVTSTAEPGAATGSSTPPLEHAQEPREHAQEPREPAKAEPPREIEKPIVVPPSEPIAQEPDASPPVTSTPEPATIALTASGLAALFGYAKRRRKSNSDD